MEPKLFALFHAISGSLFLLSIGLLFPYWKIIETRRPLLYTWGSLIAQVLSLVCLVLFILVPSSSLWFYSLANFFVLASGVCSIAGIITFKERVAVIINKQKESEEHLRLVDQVFDSVPDLIAIKDDEGKYLAANSAYRNYLGVQLDCINGKADDQLLPIARDNMNREFEKAVIETAAPVIKEEEIDGVGIFSVTRSLLQFPDGMTKGILISGNNISDYKNFQTDLRRWRIAGQTFSEALSLFLGNLDSRIEVNNLYDRIICWMNRLVECTHIAIWEADQTNHVLSLVAGSGWFSERKRIDLLYGEDVAGKVFQKNEAVTISDYKNWSDRSNKFGRNPFQFVFGQPIFVRNRIISVITMCYESPVQPISGEKLQQVENITQLISARIQSDEQLTNLRGVLEENQEKCKVIQHRGRLEHLIAMVATYFISVSDTKIDEVVVRSLQSIGKVSGIDRCYVFLFSHDGYPDLIKPVRYGNWSNSACPIPDSVEIDEEQWFLDRIKQAETICFQQVGRPEDDADNWSEWMQNNGIQSFAAIPMVTGRNLMGFLGLESIRSELNLSAENLAIYKVAADMFVNVFEKKWLAARQKKAQEEITKKVTNLEKQSLENQMIVQMGDLLQACRTADESYPIIAKYVQQLIPGASGALYLANETGDPAEKVCAWGDENRFQAETEIVSNECWALRRGRLYLVQDPNSEPVCGHIKESLRSGYICVPLNAHGISGGILHLRINDSSGTKQPVTEQIQALSEKLAEYIVMPLSNLKLRDQLRGQAIRDPLTGLFNRRYMEETLDREIRRAIRHKASIGIIMFDIDKLKPVNDRYGHDAGDYLLKCLGKELIGLFRGEDVACRYGGDEFTIVLPEAPLAEVWRRAEQMRDSIKKLQLVYDGKKLGPIQLSIGVAAFPDHGLTAERVLLACDAASYAAKSEGGDRIMMGHKLDS